MQHYGIVGFTVQVLKEIVTWQAPTEHIDNLTDAERHVLLACKKPVIHLMLCRAVI